MVREIWLPRHTRELYLHSKTIYKKNTQIGESRGRSGWRIEFEPPSFPRKRGGWLVGKASKRAFQLMRVNCDMEINARGRCLANLLPTLACIPPWIVFLGNDLRCVQRTLYIDCVAMLPGDLKDLNFEWLLYFWWRICLTKFWDAC